MHCNKDHVNFNNAEFIAGAAVDATLVSIRHAPETFAKSLLSYHEEAAILAGLRQAWKRIRQGTEGRRYVERVAESVKRFAAEA